jgi:cell shape-determining protein MreC
MAIFSTKIVKNCSFAAISDHNIDPRPFVQLLTEKIEEFKWQKNEYDKLVAENQQLNCYKRNILMLEQEKRELESKLAVISSTRRSATPDTDLGPDDLKSQVRVFVSLPRNQFCDF